MFCAAGERENATDGGRDGADARRAAEEGGGADQAETDAARHADPTAEEGDARTGIIDHNLSSLTFLLQILK